MTLSHIGAKMGREKIGSLTARDGPGPGVLQELSFQTFQRRSAELMEGGDDPALIEVRHDNLRKLVRRFWSYRAVKLHSSTPQRLK